jgi:cytochrome c553
MVKMERGMGIRQLFCLLRITAVASIALLLTTFPVRAQSVDERLKARLADSPARIAAAEAGKKAAFFCANCHGENGNSKQGEVPNLAGQNPAYLLEQIRKFTTGQRRDQFMQGLMKVLSEDDRINIAVYYADLNVLPAGKATSTTGRELYTKNCVRCHGEQGLGGEKFPRLAGQQTEYLVKSLTRYRNRSGERMDTLMLASTTFLKDADIQALAAYISAMR